MDLREALGTIKDVRVKRCRKHELLDILLLCLIGLLCGCEDVETITFWSGIKLEELRQFIPLKNGIPSADTILRVLARLDRKQFEQAFLNWTKDYFKNKTVKNTREPPCIAIDGKTLRRSNTTPDKKGIHLVSAWASELRIVLGQVKTEEKSNEITAIPELLNAMNLKGIIVTIDAMGCQKDITKLICEKKSDYVITLKGNQHTMHQDVIDFFAEAQANPESYSIEKLAPIVEKDHGRIEKREYALCTDLSWLEQKNEWEGLKSVGMVKSTRIVGGKETVEYRYFIASLTDITQVAHANRAHWGIENQLHWVLDMVYSEDYLRNRKENSAANLAILRKITLNLLRMTENPFDLKKLSLKNKRLASACDSQYLLRVLQNL